MPEEDETVEPRLTEAEWELRKIRRECAEAGHKPSDHFSSLGDPIGYWVCDCGLHTWTTPRVER